MYFFLGCYFFRDVPDTLAPEDLPKFLWIKSAVGIAENGPSIFLFELPGWLWTGAFAEERSELRFGLGHSSTAVCLGPWSFQSTLYKSSGFCLGPLQVHWSMEGICTLTSLKTCRTMANVSKTASQHSGFSKHTFPSCWRKYVSAHDETFWNAWQWHRFF